MTAVASSVFTAAQFNQFVRDNLNETAPAKATTPGSFFVASGINQISESLPDGTSINMSETTTSTTYTDLDTPGPSVTVTTRSSALIVYTCNLANTVANTESIVAHEISGATARSASDDGSYFLRTAAANQNIRAAQAMWETGLTPGSNTFTLKYRVNGGTGTFNNRRLFVLPF